MVLGDDPVLSTCQNIGENYLSSHLNVVSKNVVHTVKIRILRIENR